MTGLDHVIMCPVVIIVLVSATGQGDAKECGFTQITGQCQ